MQLQRDGLMPRSQSLLIGLEGMLVLRSLHTSQFSASIDVDRCRAVDERRVALLRLVCTATSCLFGRADTFR